MATSLELREGTGSVLTYFMVLGLFLAMLSALRLVLDLDPMNNGYLETLRLVPNIKLLSWDTVGALGARDILLIRTCRFAHDNICLDSGMSYPLVFLTALKTAFVTGGALGPCTNIWSKQ